MASMRKCMCCGDSYKYCPNCSDDKFKPLYMISFCSETCKDLWDTLSRYGMEMLTKSEAAEKIESLELKDKTEYVDCVQRDLEKVLKKDVKRGKRAELNFAEPVIEESHEVVNELEAL